MMSIKKMTIFLTISILFISFNSFAQESIKFAAIGDFGKAGSNEQAVAEMVDSWNPDFVITLGDNNYEYGEASTIDENIGQYYHQYIYPYVGSYGNGDTINRFWPSLGNHDWRTPNVQPHLDYFELPNNERYYDFVKGPVHFFVIDSDSYEPDGNTYNSTQGQWFQNKIAQSNSVWNIVYFHHPPYSSGDHGSNSFMQWPFKELGIDAVLAGHDHTYERIIRDSLVYFVNGLGGKSIYSFGTPVTGSIVRYNDDYGAMLVTVTNDSLVFEFYSISDGLVDSYTVVNPTVPVELISFNALVKNSNVKLTWETSSELNNKGFYIQRFEDNLWKNINFIRGSGTTTNYNKYSYTDINLNNGKYNYRLVQEDFNGKKRNIADIDIEVSVTPLQFELTQNYPNPFNPTTMINYQIPYKSNVIIKLYDMLGNEIKTLVNEEKSQGRYSYILNAENLPSGIYFYQLQTGDFTATKKLTLLK